MLSEKLIKEIESAIGVTDLASVISSNETIDTLEFGKTKHFSENDYRQQIINVQSDIPKDKWEEAKLAGHEMNVKRLKEEKSLNFEGRTVDSLFEYMSKQVESSKTDDIEKIKSDYEKDLVQLRKNLEDKDSEINNIKIGVKRNKIDSYLDNLFNQIQIEAPSHLKDEKQINEFVKLEREKNKTFFKSQYDFDIDDYNNVVAKKEGEIIKNTDTLSPERVDNLVQDYSKKSFMSVKQSRKGRGEGDIFPGEKGQHFKTIEDVNKYAEKRGIRPNTSEFDALVMEFNKNKE